MSFSISFSLPKFAAQMSASPAALTSATATKAEFTVERTNGDPDDLYDAANARLVADRPGWWHFDVCVRVSGVLAGNYIAAFLYVNGVRTRDLGQIVGDDATNPLVVTGSANILLDTGDYVEVFLLPSYADESTVPEAGQYSSFEGFFVP